MRGRARGGTALAERLGGAEAAGAKGGHEAPQVQDRHQGRAAVRAVEGQVALHEAPEQVVGFPAAEDLAEHDRAAAGLRVEEALDGWWQRVGAARGLKLLRILSEVCGHEALAEDLGRGQQAHLGAPLFCKPPAPLLQAAAVGEGHGDLAGSQIKLKRGTVRHRGHDQLRARAEPGLQGLKPDALVAGMLLANVQDAPRDGREELSLHLAERPRARRRRLPQAGAAQPRGHHGGCARTPEARLQVEYGGLPGGSEDRREA